MVTFAEIVEAAESLSPDEQQTLIDLLRRRLAQRNREEIVRDVEEARAEFRAGQARASTVDEIMKEARGDS